MLVAIFILGFFVFNAILIFIWELSEGFLNINEFFSTILAMLVSPFLLMIINKTIISPILRKRQKRKFKEEIERYKKEE